jgi:hypothetical protein
LIIDCVFEDDGARWWSLELPGCFQEHVGNPTLKAIAESVTSKLKRVVAAI